MKLSMSLSYTGDPVQAAEEAAQLEKAGIDMIWVAELYSFDAVSILGYLAAKTETVELTSGIFPIYSRTPTLTAMTAAGLDAVSGGRFNLGLGASGPQVIEGWHVLLCACADAVRCYAYSAFMPSSSNADQASLSS